MQVPRRKVFARIQISPIKNFTRCVKYVYICSVLSTEQMIMLLTLKIKDLALIESADISLSSGLIALTGETGSGKSLVLESVRLILGSRANKSLVRKGASCCDVQALFDITDTPHVRSTLDELDIPYEADLIVRRVVSQTGRSRAYLNGVLCPLAVLNRVVSQLVDVLTQHGFYQLLKSEHHSALIDAVGQHESDAIAVRDSYADIRRIEGEIHELETRSQAMADREDYIRFQIREIEDAELHDPTEIESLEAECATLRNLQRLLEYSHGAGTQLYHGEDAIIDRVKALLYDSERTVQFDKSLSALVDQLYGAVSALEDVATSLSEYQQRLPDDHSRLDWVENRLNQLCRLRRKYGGSLDEVIERYTGLKTELLGLTDVDGQLERLRIQRLDLVATLEPMALRLSEHRMQTCQVFLASVVDQMRLLGMDDAEMDVERRPVKNGISSSLGSIGPNGLYALRFLLKTNKGYDAQPIESIASGGELSRVMLSIKRVMASQDTVSTYLFDEVDAGVGGETGETIADMLHDIAEQRQVICVTHLAQVASRAETHLRISKTSVHAQTRTCLEMLNSRTRIAEIARMIGGRADKSHTRLCAEEMLRASAQAA
ncbi:MAG: DNA repair protein RecN [Myxococcales bacterium]|nr:DNA repair protein RecN [Myxococcales bacterium]